MTTENRPPSGPTPENMVSYSERLLNISISRLTRVLESYDDITPACGKELTEEFRSLRKALEIAYHERAQLQKLKGVDAASGTVLDLCAAREEITRRISCLRAARDGDGIPRQSE
ncbi:MAG: hypothetical protein ACNA7L_04705 [Roseinatronobacter sp.]